MFDIGIVMVELRQKVLVKEKEMERNHTNCSTHKQLVYSAVCLASETDKS